MIKILIFSLLINIEHVSILYRLNRVKRYFSKFDVLLSFSKTCYFPISFSIKKTIIEKRNPTGKRTKALLKFFNISGVPSSVPSILPTPMHRAAISACLFFFQYSISFQSECLRFQNP